MARAIAIALSVLVAVGCASSSPSAHAIAGASRGKPTSNATRLAPPCRPWQLRGKHFSQGAGGAEVGGITFDVVKGPRCSLLGRPRVAFRGGTAKTVPWRVYRLPALDEPGLNRPPDVLRSLRHGDRVLAPLHWGTWCRKHGTEPPPAPTALIVTLPAGGPEFRFGLLRDHTPRCDVPGMTSQLGIGRFVAPKP